MANTYVDYTAVASQTDYNFSFEYLRDEHVKVKVNGSETSDFTIVTSPTPTKIRFNTAPAAGAAIKIYRDSRGDFSPLVDFVDGSILTENELDEGYKHNLFLSQEASEGTGGEQLTKKGLTHYDAEGNKIINLGTPTGDADAANKAYTDQAIDNAIALGGSPAIVSLGGYDVTSTNATTKQLRAWTADIETGDKSNTTVTATGTTTARTLADRFANSVNILDYIPSDKHAGIVAGTNTDDLSSYFEDAIETSKRVFIPKGTYHLNANINSKTILEGEGTASTFLKPYDGSGAVFVYTFTAQQTPVYDFWDYHSEVSNICFTKKTTDKVGIGFAFGKTTVAAYTADDEYANNVKFKGCFFKNLEKGVMFTFGNIGTEFYSCGFSSNKYGAYLLDGKGTGSLMHAGNKHFFAGEFSTNECAVYIHNDTDGFGEVTFNSTIFEYNRMACYIYNGTRTYTPLSWSGCWFEKNGTLETDSGQSQVTIDAWTGTTRSDQTIDHRTIQLEGLSSQLIFDKTGIFTDCKVDGNYHTVVATNCRVETEVGVGGADFEVVSDSSRIEINNPITSSGIERADGLIVTGIPTLMSEGAEIDSNTGRGRARDFRIVARGSKITNYGASLETSIPFETQVDTGGGSFNLTGSVVSDGLIYASCNEYTRASFLSTQYTRVNGSPITTTAGFYVYTFDFKRTLGNPKVHLWNRGTVQFATTITAPSLNRWYTFGGIGYSPGSQSFFLDFSGDGSDCTWRMSAYQLHRFDSMVEAQSFLESKVYAAS